MFDGAAVADAAHVAPDAAAKALIPVAPAPVQVRAADPSQDGGKKEVVFVDTSVADYKALEAAVKAGVEIEEIDGSQSGLAQIAQWAETHTGYDSISLLSHGAEGVLHLGTDAITDAALSDATVQAELAEIGHSLNAGGDLLLYGCDIAKGDDGQQFITDLAAATGADVAASTDTTGKDGNWTLERATGDIRATAFEDASYQDALSVGDFSFTSATGAGGHSYTETENGVTVTVTDNFNGTYTPGGSYVLGSISDPSWSNADYVYTYTFSSAVDLASIVYWRSGGASVIGWTMDIADNNGHSMTLTGIAASNGDPNTDPGKWANNNTISLDWSNVTTLTLTVHGVYVSGGPISYEARFGAVTLQTPPPAPTVTAGDGVTTEFGASDTRGIDTSLAFSSSSGWNGGSLTVTITGGCDATNDILSVIDGGGGSFGITVSGNTITYNAYISGPIVIGTIDAVNDGSIGHALTITFTAAADDNTVSALAKSIGLSMAGTSSTANRSVTFTATDSGGGHVTATATATVVGLMVGGGTANQNVADTSTLTPLSSVTVSDTQAEGMIIAILLDSTKGSFTNIDGWTGFSFPAGSFPVAPTADFYIALNVASAAEAQAALRALVYQPMAHAGTAGSTATTPLSILISGADTRNSAYDAKTSVVIRYSSADPAMTAGGGGTVTSVGGGAVTIDPVLSFSDGGVGWNGGKLDIGVYAGSDAEYDTFTIKNTAGGITTSGGVTAGGGTVYYNGTAIGIIGDGVGNDGTPGHGLTITFNASATDAAVSALARAIQFSSPGTTSSDARVISLSASNSTQAGVSAMDTVTVGAAPAAASAPPSTPAPSPTPASAPAVEAVAQASVRADAPTPMVTVIAPPSSAMGTSVISFSASAFTVAPAESRADSQSQSFADGLAAARMTAAPDSSAYRVPVLAAQRSGAGDALVAVRPVAETQNGDAGISYTLAPDTFAHTSANAVVTLNAALQDGRPLPAWLIFNPRTGSFTGRPPAGMEGTLEVRVVAHDQQGREAAVAIRIRVGERTTLRLGSLRDGAGIRHAGKPAFTQQLKLAARNAAIRFS